MSWNGTVRCRYCHNEGHNVKGCPERKAFIKEHLGQDTYEGKRALHLHSVYDSKENRRARRCKWCQAEGHDIRKCPDITKKVDAMTEKCLEARKSFASKMIETSFGPGSLIRYKNKRFWNNDIQDYDYAYSIGLVEKIDWKNITHHSRREDRTVPMSYNKSVLVVPVNPNDDWSKGRMVALPTEIAGYMISEEPGYEISKLLSGTAALIPLNFLDEKSIGKLMRRTFLKDNGLKK